MSIYTSPSKVESISRHGCWCAKFGSRDLEVSLGGQPVDELDGICKKWIKDRRCSKLFDGTCYIVG